MRQITGIGRVARRALADYRRNWLMLVGVNALWAVATLTVFFAPLALFGLFYVANLAAHKRQVEFNDAFRGARMYLVKSLQWGALNLIAGVLFWGNFALYPRFAGQLAAPLVVVTLALLIAWVCVQFYTVPYLLEMEKPSLRVALRNGAFTALASPVLTLGLMGIVLLMVLLCAVQPVVIFVGMGALIALIANHALLERLEAFGLRTPETGTAQAAEADDPLLRDEK
ncbi:MAG: hypothetical protein ABI835_17580 [Chloroflexota bacterium]